MEETVRDGSGSSIYQSKMKISDDEITFETYFILSLLAHCSITVFINNAYVNVHVMCTFMYNLLLQVN